MASRFKKAVKAESKLRLALIAPSGGGKTMTALIVARVLSQKRIAVIDTERGSASKYADQFDFDVDELESHSPDAYCEAIEAAAASGDYDVLVIDSLSHAWMGRDGALEQVDKEASRSKSGSSFSAWRHVTPMHNRLVDTMVQAPLHVIATMRAKTEWVQEKDERGKTNIRKVGMAAVQRDGVEYEFDVVGDMEPDRNTLVISKTRCPDLAGAVLEKPGPEFGETLQRWLAGAVTPFGRAIKAIMDARTEPELNRTAELAQGLGPAETEKLRAIFRARRDRIREVSAAMGSTESAQAEPGGPVVEPEGASEEPDNGPAAAEVDPLVPPNLMAVETEDELPEPLAGAFCFVDRPSQGQLRWRVADMSGGDPVWRQVRAKADRERLGLLLANHFELDLKDVDAVALGRKLLKVHQ
ncbi:MAG: ATP-binding protein [Planctomycetes bacterium]|nr:ATP-binding protein [Planctomycetota bacterium]